MKRSALCAAALVVCVSANLTSGSVVYTVQDLGTLGGSYSSAADINNVGQIVGNSETSDGDEHAFLYFAGAMKDLGTLGGERAYAHAINDVGQIVGESSTSGGGEHAFLYFAGAMNDLGTLGGRSSESQDLNDSGQVVGSSPPSTGDIHAFLYFAGVMTDLGTLGGKWSRADAINSKGQIVGGTFTATGDGHAFLYSDGTMTDLGTLGGKESTARGINDRGQVVGSSTSTLDSGSAHAFLYSGGIMTDLGTLGGDLSEARAINARGQIIGGSRTASSDVVHAFIYDGGKMQDLNEWIAPSSNWVLVGAEAINDKGQIVGAGFYDGAQRAFLLTPVSEPAWFWNSLGNGNWHDIDPVTGNSRWVDEVGAPLATAPGDESAVAVIRTNQVTLTRDLTIRSLSVESGSLALGNNTTLTLQEGADFAAGSTLALGNVARLTVAGGAGRLADVTGAQVGVLDGEISLSGDLSMGARLGSLVIDGNLTVEGTATYHADLGGPACDLVAVTRNVVLQSGSTLALSGASPLRDPQSGRTWGNMDRTVLTAETILGTFTNAPTVGQYLGSGVWLGDSGGRGISYAAGAGGVNELHVAVFQAAPGDTNGDRTVAADDIQNILAAAKFNAGRPGEWTEGDFDGDGLITSLDIQMVLAASLFNSGPYAAGSGDDQAALTDQPNVLLRVTAAGLLIDTQGSTLNGYVLTSATAAFTGEPANNLGLLQEDTDTRISGQMFFALNGTHLLGRVVRSEWSGVDLTQDLSMTYTVEGHPGIYSAAVVVPEPSALVMLVGGVLIGLLRYWHRAGRRTRNDFLRCDAL